MKTGNIIAKLRPLIAGAAAVAALTCVAQSGSDIKVHAALDSAQLLMGRTTPLHVTVTGTLNETGGVLLPDTLWREVEIADPGTPEVTDLGNGRKELRQEVILQAFDSGTYSLPPVLYLQDGKVSESNRPALKVYPVAVDSMQTIHDYADVQLPPSHFFDWLPDWITDYGWWILLALVLIGGALFIYLVYLRKGKIPLVPAKKPVPPYELAMQQLESLRADKLCELGEEKEYYTRLTDILRNYLDSRFGINAMEMTSSQIRHALSHNPDTRVPAKYMDSILATADFVKFAKVRPLPDDNVASFNSALRFVEDTRPAPEPVPEGDDKKADKQAEKTES